MSILTGVGPQRKHIWWKKYTQQQWRRAKNDEKDGSDKINDLTLPTFLDAWFFRESSFDSIIGMENERQNREQGLVKNLTYMIEYLIFHFFTNHNLIISLINCITIDIS